LRIDFLIYFTEAFKSIQISKKYTGVVGVARPGSAPGRSSRTAAARDSNWRLLTK